MHSFKTFYNQISNSIQQNFFLIGTCFFIDCDLLLCDDFYIFYNSLFIYRLLTFFKSTETEIGVN